AEGEPHPAPPPPGPRQPVVRLVVTGPGPGGTAGEAAPELDQAVGEAGRDPVDVPAPQRLDQAPGGRAQVQRPVRRPRSPTRPSARRVETLSTCPPSSGSITSRVARAAVQATGVPPKVVPWSPRCMTSATSVRAMVAPIG